MLRIRKLPLLTALSVTITAVSLLCGARSLAGPFSHQRNQLPGPRAAAMGGAFVAVANDPSAVYWNPAGYSLIDRPEVSVSGIGLIQSATRYDETVSDEPFIERAQSLSPGFFGASIRNGRFGAGYGFAALDERNVNQNDSFMDVPLVSGERVDYYRTYQESSTLASAGAGMSWLVGGGMSVGVSGAYYRRQSAVSNFQSVAGSGDSFTTRNLKYETLNEGLLGTGGILLVSGRFRAGLSYRYPWPLSNNTTVSNSVADSPGTSGLPGSENQLSSVEGKSSELDEPGIRTYQLGLAWGVPGQGLLAVDVVKHATGEAEEARGLRTTYNYSAGFEASIGGVVWRGGLFTNLSLYPEPSASQANQPTAIDYQGYSWGIGLVQQSREFAITYVRQAGSGTAQLVADSHETQKVSGTLENLLLSSRVFF